MIFEVNSKIGGYRKLDLNSIKTTNFTNKKFLLTPLIDLKFLN